MQKTMGGGDAGLARAAWDWGVRLLLGSGSAGLRGWLYLVLLADLALALIGLLRVGGLSIDPWGGAYALLGLAPGADLAALWGTPAFSEAFARFGLITTLFSWGTHLTLTRMLGRPLHQILSWPALLAIVLGAGLVGICVAGSSGTGLRLLGSVVAYEAIGLAALICYGLADALDWMNRWLRAWGARTII